MLYENSYKQKSHFSFGENWSNFLKKISQKRITDAKRSLVDFLGDKNILKNKTFIDIGCGSGLFSYAAYNLGAKKVVSTDIDRHSIRCANYLKKQAGNPSNWQILTGSILDDKFVGKLGMFDVVYSWGVLHHTGDMYSAFNNIIKLCAPKQFIYLAIYNNNCGKNAIFSGSSKFWFKLKKVYNNTSTFGKKVIEILYLAYFFVGYIVTFRSPLKYIKQYNDKSVRGMDFMTDIRDWLGGYPYEYVHADELVNYFSRLGFMTKKLKISDNLGCHELLMQKE